MNRFTLIVLILFGVMASGCATKTLQVNVPTAEDQARVIGYVEIKEINDLREFERSPDDPSVPSIEGDFIDNKELTNKVIGRMRHGLYHKALWNYTIKGDKDIYDVCREIVSSSLASAGYIVLSESDSSSENAIPIAIDILQFWAWMQPKFNIDLNFDGELRLRSLLPHQGLQLTAEGHHHFSTSFAGGGAWTTLIEEGVKDLDKNLVLKVKSDFKE